MNLSSGKNHVKVSISVLTRAELIPAMPLSGIRRRVTDMVTFHFLFSCWYVLKALLLLAFNQFHYIIVDWVWDLRNSIVQFLVVVSDALIRCASLANETK